MRTLPLRLSPVDGESLAGYVARYSHTFGLQPGDLVRALGLDAVLAASGRAATASRSRPTNCTARRAAASAVTVAGDKALLAAQQRIDALLDGDLGPTLAGEQLEPLAYLSDLRTLAKLLNCHDHLSANRSQARSGPLARASGSGARLLDDPGALAAVLPEGLRLADLPTGPRSRGPCANLPTWGTAPTARRCGQVR